MRSIVTSAVIFGTTFLTYLATAANTSHQPNDTVATLAPAWHLASYGNLTLDHFRGWTAWFVEAHGRVVSNRLPGTIFFAAPFYWLLGRGGDWPSFFPASVAAAFATAGAVTIMFFVLRRLVDTRLAVVSSLLLAFGTGTWTTSGHALWTHGPNQLWIAAGLLLATRGWPLAAGLALGAGIFTRPYTAIFAAIFGVTEGLQRRRVRWVVRIAAGSSVGLITYIAYNAHMFGGNAAGVALGGYGGDNLASSLSGSNPPLLTNLAGLLVSPERGVLLLSPALLLLLPGIPRAWRVAPSWVRSAALGGLGYMAVELRHNYFHGGYGFFSYRIAVEWVMVSLPLLVVAYREWTALTRRRRNAFAALATLSVAMHAVGALTPTRTALTNPWRTFDVAFSFQHYTGRSVMAAALVTLLAAAVIRWLSQHSSDDLDDKALDQSPPVPASMHPLPTKITGSSSIGTGHQRLAEE